MFDYVWNTTRRSLGLLCLLGSSAGCAGNATPETMSSTTAPIAGAPAISMTATAAATPPVATTPVTNTTPPTSVASTPATTPTTPPAASSTPATNPSAPANPAAPTTPPPATTTTTAPPQPGKLAMDECGLHTKYAGDEYCILPPPKDQGFQLHIGPTGYDNVSAQYLLQPGEERTDDFPTVSSNDKEIYFYYRQYRQRTGAHHNIITSGGGGDSGLGQRIATFNVLAEDYPRGGVIAPENNDVGIRMPASTSINVSLHSINTSEKVELREVWVNFWYRDASAVKEPVTEVFSIAPMGIINPGDHVTTHGSCNVSGDGRMLWAYIHRHANTVRTQVWRQRAGKKDMVYLSYDWEDVLQLEFASTITNPPGDEASMKEGGWSGVLDTKVGDQFVWDCEVINKQATPLAFTNNTYTGEMCILDAEMVGGGCN